MKLRYFCPDAGRVTGSEADVDAAPAERNDDALLELVSGHQWKSAVAHEDVAALISRIRRT
jgi:hypothetical protein